MWRMRHVGTTRLCSSFLKRRGRNLLAAEATAGVRHPFGAVDRRRRSSSCEWYLRAKVAQENLIKASKVPFTIVRSTQFFEFVRASPNRPRGQTVRLSPGMMQPIAADDVAAAVTDVAVAEP